MMLKKLELVSTFQEFFPFSPVKLWEWSIPSDGPGVKEATLCTQWAHWHWLLALVCSGLLNYQKIYFFYPQNQFDLETPDAAEYWLFNGMMVRVGDTGELIICDVKHFNINVFVAFNVMLL